MSTLKELLHTLVTALVDDPSRVQIVETDGERRVMLELKVARDDVGKVIGRRGRTAAALRTILSAAAAKQGKRALLDIIDSDSAAS